MRSISLLEKVYKTIDAVITAPLNEKVSARQNAKILILSGASNYKRIGAFINLINRVVPGIDRKASKYLMRSKKLPLAEGRLALLNYGSGSTVFRYQNAYGDHVVKISRVTMGKSLATLLKFSRQYKENSSKLAGWYNDKHLLVLPTHFLITQSSFLDTPCVASIQAYMYGKQEDLLRDFDDEQIVHMMKQDRQLGDQFMDFFRGTLHAIESEGLCLDMLGKNNLMLLTREDARQLLIVDYGIFNLDTLARDMPEKLKLVDKDIQRLKILAQRIA